MENQVQATAKKPGKVGTVFFCLWVVLAVILIQGAVSAIGAIPASISLFMKAGGDQELFMQLYTEMVSDAGLLTWLQFAAEIVCIVVLLIWYNSGYVKPDKAKGIYKPFLQKVGGAPDFVFIIAGVLSAWGLASLLQMLAAGLFPDAAAKLSESLQSALGGNEIIGMLTGVILAPICEELAVRGIILRRSERVFGAIGVMIISAVLFGVFHMNIIQGLYVLPMGAFWGYVGYRYKSVIPCFLCHIINNGLAFLIPGDVDQLILSVALFVIFGAVAAFVGVRFNLLSLNRAATVPAETLVADPVAVPVSSDNEF